MRRVVQVGVDVHRLVEAVPADVGKHGQGSEHPPGALLPDAVTGHARRRVQVRDRSGPQAVLNLVRGEPGVVGEHQ